MKSKTIKDRIILNLTEFKIDKMFYIGVFCSSFVRFLIAVLDFEKSEPNRTETERVRFVHTFSL